MRAPKSYEEGMDRLNAILVQMQQEQTLAADSVKLYAEAASLMQYCHATLDKTSLQIEEIDAKIAETVEARRSSGGRIMEYKAQYQMYLRRLRLRWMRQRSFLPRNQKYAGLLVTACWAVESASARFWRSVSAICWAARCRVPHSSRQLWRCCIATR